MQNLIAVNPQQNIFEFGSIKFDSRFDSGNLANVTNPELNKFDLWISSDGLPYSVEKGYRVWFHFSVSGITSDTNVTFTIRNMSDESPLFRLGFRPVVKECGKDWEQIKGSISYNFQESFVVVFNHLFISSDPVFFALMNPYGYGDSIQMCKEIADKYKESKEVYAHQETAIHSIEGRDMKLLTISSFTGITEEREEYIEGLFPDKLPRPFKFNKEKPCVFLTARVHPGELPGSLMLNGLIKLILDDSEQGKLLRENFVFKIIPILNPDGVYRGYYRFDTQGVNLNRYYDDPNKELQPTIYAAKALLIQQSKNDALKFYIDFHAHAGKLGGFMFGNALDPSEQVENLLFPKLVSLNSINFDFAESIFSEKSMRTKDRKGGKSKEGSGRVAIYKATKLVHCYTLECNYHRAKRINYIPTRINVATQEIVPETPITNASSDMYKGETPPAYTIDHFEDIGHAVGFALLDYYEKNPLSRIPRSMYKTLEGVRKGLSAKAYISSMRPEGEFAKHIKSNKSWTDPPIVLVTKEKTEDGTYKIVEETIDPGKPASDNSKIDA